MSAERHDTTTQEEEERASSHLDASLILEGLLAIVAHPVIIFDGASRPIWTNSAVVSAWGFNPVALAASGDSAYQLAIQRLNIRYQDGGLAPFNELPSQVCLRGHSIRNQRLVFRNGDGADCLVSVTATPLFAHHRVVGAALTWQDISEREQLLGQLEAARDQAKAAIEAHLASDERFRAIGGVVPFGLWTANSAGQLIYVSDSFRELIGLPLEAFQGTGWTDRVRPEDLEPMLSSWKHCMETGQVRDFEYKIRDKYGEYRSILTRGVPSRDAAGNVTSWVGIQLDVTERQRALEALAESEKRARTQYKSFPIPTYSWQRSGDEFVLVDYNDAAYEITRGRIKERIGIEASTVYKDTPELSDCIKACWEQRTTIRRGTKFRMWSTGELKDLSLTYVLVPPDVVMMHTEDITARRQAEREVQEARDQLETRVCERTAELRSAIAEREGALKELETSREQLRSLAVRVESIREEERTRIAREVHDELGQVLTGIKMDLFWLQSRMPRATSGDSRSTIAARIRSAIQHTDEAVRSVRRIATELRPGVLDALGLTAAIEWQTKDLEQRTGIKCHCRCEVGNLRLGGDLSTALFRILQEALTNVTRHAGATDVSVVLERDQSLLKLTIEDNGSGISASAISDASSLGLLGMRERAHQFGGDLTIVGSPKVGSTLVICIPLRNDQ